ncbi:DNA polymerase IV [Anaerococcus sp. mt242]|uniref:DNA polymerase IV n=1 Tax=Anaerococcus sp. mt242 TaxID=2661917 RepID=UPI001934B247|nr:DNA polymerase IV [Anaerococcus sp. mt242]MBM0046496.1 DNA polymerase IV [Anaerococcus sp. mt242]
MKRIILHSDMNACYASIEAKLNPKLKGIPMAVAGNPENHHGIILAKSEEAKKMGVKTGEPIWQAKGKCPNLTLVPPHYEEYLKHSKMARSLYYEYTNQVEPFGLDECYLDVTGYLYLFGSGEEIAHEIRNRMKEELGLTVSIGVSFCKIFAKLGSDMKKPDAVTVITEDNFKQKVWPLGVREMVGIGRATEKKLNKIGIFSLGDLAHAPVKTLKSLLGINGVYLWQYANGLDIRPIVDRDHTESIKSIGNSSTCKRDLHSDEEVFNVMQELSFSVSRRLREAKLEARGVEVFVRNNELQSWNFAILLEMASQSSIILVRRAMEIFKKKYNWSFPVRAVGIRAINLRNEGGGSQMDVFLNHEKFKKNEDVDTALYNIRKKYGKDSITFAALKRDIGLSSDITEVVTLPSRHYNM